MFWQIPQTWGQNRVLQHPELESESERQKQKTVMFLSYLLEGIAVQSRGRSSADQPGKWLHSNPADILCWWTWQEFGWTNPSRRGLFQIFWATDQRPAETQCGCLCVEWSLGNLRTPARFSSTGPRSQNATATSGAYVGQSACLNRSARRQRSTHRSLEHPSGTCPSPWAAVPLTPDSR